MIVTFVLVVLGFINTVNVAAAEKGQGSRFIDFAQHSAVDSGDFVILTNDGRVYEADEGQPKWPPDGRKIAYVKAKELWYMNSDGSNQTHIPTSEPITLGLTWHPDSQKIYFITEHSIYTSFSLSSVWIAKSRPNQTNRRI